MYLIIFWSLDFFVLNCFPLFYDLLRNKYIIIHVLLYNLIVVYTKKFKPNFHFIGYVTVDSILFYYIHGFRFT